MERIEPKDKKAFLLSGILLIATVAGILSMQRNLYIGSSTVSITQNELGREGFPRIWMTYDGVPGERFGQTATRLSLRPDVCEFNKIWVYSGVNDCTTSAQNIPVDISLASMIAGLDLMRQTVSRCPNTQLLIATTPQTPAMGELSMESRQLMDNWNQHLKNNSGKGFTAVRICLDKLSDYRDKLHANTREMRDKIFWAFGHRSLWGEPLPGCQ